MNTIPKDQWVWMPHPAHFICGHRCRFHLATRIGQVIVSTVGEYWPENEVREIIAETKGVVINGRGDAREADYMKKIGFEEIGHNRKYETMVFRAAPRDHPTCCRFQLSSGHEIDFRGYNKPEDAYAGHLELCDKWAKDNSVPAEEDEA